MQHNTDARKLVPFWHDSEEGASCYKKKGESSSK